MPGVFPLFDVLAHHDASFSFRRDDRTPDIFRLSPPLLPPFHPLATLAPFWRALHHCTESRQTEWPLFNPFPGALKSALEYPFIALIVSSSTGHPPVDTHRPLPIAPGTADPQTCIPGALATLEAGSFVRLQAKCSLIAICCLFQSRKYDRASHRFTSRRRRLALRQKTHNKKDIFNRTHLYINVVPVGREVFEHRLKTLPGLVCVQKHVLWRGHY